MLSTSRATSYLLGSQVSPIRGRETGEEKEEAEGTEPSAIATVNLLWLRL